MTEFQKLQLSISCRQNPGKGVALPCVNDKLSKDLISIPFIEHRHMTAEHFDNFPKESPLSWCLLLLLFLFFDQGD